MEFIESLLSSSRHQQLQVRLTSERSCWVGLPSSLAAALHESRQPLPVVLRLHGPTVPGGQRHVAWAGAASRSPAVLEIPSELAKCLGLHEGLQVGVEILAGVPMAESVSVDPAGADDWEKTELNAGVLEDAVLQQVAVVEEGLPFPFWLHGGSRLALRATAVVPGPLARLGPGTELIVAPRLRLPPPSSDPGQRQADFGQNGPLMWRRIMVVPGEVQDEAAPLTTFVFLSEDDFRPTSHTLLSPGVRIELPSNSSTLSIANGDRLDCPKVFSLPCSAVPPGHVAVSSALQNLLGLHTGSRIPIRGLGVLASGMREYDEIPLHAQLRPVIPEHAEKAAMENENAAASICAWFRSSNNQEHAIGGLDESHRMARGAELYTALEYWWRQQLSRAAAICMGNLLRSRPLKAPADCLGGFPGTALQNGVVMIISCGSNQGGRSSQEYMEQHKKAASAASSSPSKSFIVSLSLQDPAAKLRSGKPLHGLVSGTARAAELSSLRNFASGESEPSVDLGPPVESPALFPEMVLNKKHRDFLPAAPVIKEPLASSSSWLANALATVAGRAAAVLLATPREMLLGSNIPLPGGSLVSGSSGCGKTSLLCRVPEAVAALSSVSPGNFCLPISPVYVACSDLVGEDAKEVRRRLSAAILMAENLAPSILLLDDLDALFPSPDVEDGGDNREDQEDPSGGVADWLAGALDEARIKSLNEAAVGGSCPWPVAFVASCADPAQLTHALRAPGRLDFEVELPQLGLEDRQQIVACALEARKLKDPKGAISHRLGGLDGCDPADVGILADRARLSAMRRALVAGPGRVKVESPLQIDETDAVDAFDGFVASSMRGIAQAPGHGSVGASLTGWEDVGGVSEAIEALREALDLAAVAAAWAHAAPLRLRTGLLLYGAPGTGKTHLVRCAVAATGMRLVAVKGPELLNKYIGQSEAGVRGVFAKASAAAPCVLFFDEFDALAPKRGHDNSGVTDRVVNALLAELDGVQGLSGVVVLAATSRPDLIDAALLRPGRLDRAVECGIPGPQERSEIAAALARKLPLAPGADPVSVARSAQGLNGADIAAALSDAQLAAVHARLESMTPGPTSQTGGSMVHVTQENLRQAFAAVRPSLTKKEQQRLGAIYQRFRGERSGDVTAALIPDSQKKVTLA